MTTNLKTDLTTEYLYENYGDGINLSTFLNFLGLVTPLSGIAISLFIGTTLETDIDETYVYIVPHPIK